MPTLRDLLSSVRDSVSPARTVTPAPYDYEGIVANRQGAIEDSQQLTRVPSTKTKHVTIDDPSGALTGTFDTALLNDINTSARMHGVDPYVALAVAAQESAFKTTNPMGYFPAGAFVNNTFVTNDDPESGLSTNTPLDIRRIINIDASMRRLKDKTARQSKHTPNDAALILQSYNGMGRVPNPSRTGKDGRERMAGRYGGQTQEMVGRVDKPYGKRILEIVSMLKQQPDVVDIVKQYQPATTTLQNLLPSTGQD